MNKVDRSIESDSDNLIFFMENTFELDEQKKNVHNNNDYTAVAALQRW